MAVAEHTAGTETAPEATRSREGGATLRRDDFVKRRQEARAAAGDGGTAGEGDGDEISPLETAAVAGEGDGEHAGHDTQASAEPTDDLSFFDDDEIGEEEPSTLTGLEPPASMTAAEKQAFEELPDAMKSYVARVHTSAAKKVSESGETVAARSKEIEERVAALDHQLVQAKAVLEDQIDNLPLRLPHSDEALAKIAEDEGFEAWQKASRENATARAEHDKAVATQRGKLSEIEQQIAERRKQILQQFQQVLPKLIPSWAKPEVRKKEAAELGQYLLHDGFTEAELKQVADARLVRLARKAMRYDAALAKKREAGKGRTANGTGRATAQPGATSGRRSTPSGNAELEAAEKRYREKPSADNFARLRRLKRAAAEQTSRRRV